MELKPITNQYDYQQAQKYLESIHRVELSKEESNKVSILTVLIEEFERKSKPVEEEINKMQ